MAPIRKKWLETVAITNKEQKSIRNLKGDIEKRREEWRIKKHIDVEWKGEEDRDGKEIRV